MRPALTDHLTHVRHLLDEARQDHRQLQLLALDGVTAVTLHSYRRQLVQPLAGEVAVLVYNALADAAGQRIAQLEAELAAGQMQLDALPLPPAAVLRRLPIPGADTTAPPVP